MTTEQDIMEQVEREFDKFRNKLYDGPLPDGCLEKFKFAIFNLPWRAHGYNFAKVKTIIAKTFPSELTWLEVGMVLNLIAEVPYANFFDTLEEALEYHIKASEIMSDYNQVANAKSEEMEKYRKRLLTMSGITKDIGNKSRKN